MKKKPAFSLDLDRTGGYHVLAISVYPETEYSSRTVAFKLRYQSTIPETSDWYGSTLTIEADSLYQLDTSSKLIARLFKNSDKFTKFHLGGRVKEVLQALLKVCDEVIYDNRVSTLVPIAEVLPADYHAYRDAWQDYGFSADGCTVGCVARDDDEARRLMTIEFAGLSYRKERFEAWLAAGRPVKQLTDYYQHPVVDVTAADLIAQIDNAKASKAGEECAA